MTSPTAGYAIIGGENNRRIYAVDHHGVEIAGAYQPAGHDYWCLYVTKLVTNLTDIAVPPHREHFWGRSGCGVAKAWVELIAALYAKAIQANGEMVA